MGASSCVTVSSRVRSRRPVVTAGMNLMGDSISSIVFFRWAIQLQSARTIFDDSDISELKPNPRKKKQKTSSKSTHSKNSWMKSFGGPISLRDVIGPAQLVNEM